MKVELMKQNKNTPVVRVASAALAAFVLFFSLCIPSFATNFGDYNQPLPIITNGSAEANWQAGLSVGNNSAANQYRSVAVSDTTGDVYYFAYRSSSTYWHACFISFDSSFYAISTSKSTPNNTYTSITNDSGQSISSYLTVDGNRVTYYEYTGNSNVQSSYVWSCPTYDTKAEGINDIYEYVTNGGGGGGSTPHPLTLTVPAGNAVYIDVTGVSTVRASLSMSSEVAHPQSWVSNQYYGWASSYPSSIAGNPSGSTPIPWSGYGDKTILNRYKTFSWSLTAVGNSNYLFICNPYATIDEYDQSFNPTIYVSLDEAVGYKYYQLTGGIGADGTIGQQSDGTTASGSYNDGTQSWDTTDDNTGLPWSPQEGGGNIITQNSINSWLQQISTQIGNFFSGAIGAVTTLIGAGSDFIQSLSGLYSWLPGPVYAVLSSALILVITIGVIKVFI